MTKSVDIDLFEHLVRESLIVFKEIIEQHRDVYVLGLYHMGGFDGVLPMFNTLSDVPLAPDSNASEMDWNAYYDAMWAPSSYPMLEAYGDRLPDSEQALANMSNSDNATAQWERALNSMVLAMKTAATNPLFTELTNTPVFYVATYDESWSERRTRIAEINPSVITEMILPSFEFMEKLQDRWENEAWNNVFGNQQ